MKRNLKGGKRKKVLVLKRGGNLKRMKLGKPKGKSWN
jgi:hypothetical protein